MPYSLLQDTWIGQNIEYFENFDSQKHKIGFIHITKSGGTNIKDKNKTNELYFGSYHYENAIYYYKKQMSCFAIIRNPIERYESMFYYNTFGSNKYSKSNDIKDINLFVDKHYNDPNFIKKFEDGTQFRKQISWLGNKDTANNTFIVLYDKNNLIEHIQNFIKKEFRIDFMYDSDEKNINVTNYSESFLTEESKAKIKEMYKEDMELYEKFTKYLEMSKTGDKYCKLSVLLT